MEKRQIKKRRCYKMVKRSKTKQNKTKIKNNKRQNKTRGGSYIINPTLLNTSHEVLAGTANST